MRESNRDANNGRRKDTSGGKKGGKHTHKTYSYASTAQDRKEKKNKAGEEDQLKRVAPKRKLEISFDKGSRVDYLTGFRKRKEERRTFGLAMQKVKDRREKLEKRSEDREARKKEKDESMVMSSSDVGDGDDDGDCDDNDHKSKRRKKADVEVDVTNYADADTVQTFGGDVSVSISHGLPSDSEEEEEDRLLTSRYNEPSKHTNDAEQRYAGNVEKYVNQLKGNLPSKKKNKQDGKKVWKGKGKHGAAEMSGMGGGGGVKMAKKMLGRFEEAGRDAKGGGSKGHKGRKGGGGKKSKRGRS